MPPLTVSTPLAGIPFHEALGVLEQGHLLSATVPMPPQLLDGVLQAVESVPGALDASDAARIRGLIQQGYSGEAFRRLAVFRDVLQAARRECEAAAPASDAVPLDRIGSLLGLPSPEDAAYGMAPEDERLASKAAPLDPRFAGRVEIEFRGESEAYSLGASDGILKMRLGRESSAGLVVPDATVSANHAEIRFFRGRYWISDQGSTNGTYHNGHRLAAFERRPLRDGDNVILGRCELTVRLPYEIRLRHLEERLKAGSSFPKILEILAACGFSHIVPTLQDVLKFPATLDERLKRLREIVPHDGGLLIRLESFLLRGEAVRRCIEYFPGRTPRESLEAGLRLTASLAQSHSFQDLAGRLKNANPEGFQFMTDEIEKMQRLGLSYRKSGGGLRVAEMPNLFGLRAQVHRLFMQGLPLQVAQMWDLHWRGVTPDLLLERPWASLEVSPLLEEALEAFRGIIEGRLNLDDMEKSIQDSQTDQTDAPLVLPARDVTLGTVQLLYKEYQAESGRTGEAPIEDPSAKPEFFGQVARRLAADGISMQEHETWMFGGAVPFTADGRIYLSLRRPQAEAIFRYLHDTVETGIAARGGSIQYKISGHPDGYGRSDSGVIYFQARDQEAIYRLMIAMSRAHPEFFKEGHPRFTMPLRDEDGDALAGLSFGEEPLTNGESFGTLRAQAMTTAVRTARALMTSEEPPDWRDIRRICVFFLEKAGVNLENPAFNAYGREAFEWLLKRCESKSEADAAQSEAFILAEILQRYPRLATLKAARLVRTVARIMHKAWEKDHPGGSRGFFRQIPEDIFEEKMAAVLRKIEQDPDDPVMKQFREAIVDGDQGPRALRALVERIASHCPTLRNPRNEKLLKSLAGNIHKTWKAQETDPEDLETVFRRKIASLIRRLEEDGAPFSRTLRSELRGLLAFSGETPFS